MTTAERSVLTSEHLEAYRRQGYVAIEGAVPPAWLARLLAASEEFVEESRSLTASTPELDLEPDHSASTPRLRRLSSPVDHHPTFAEFALRGPAADIARDLLGSPARYHHSKLNYKWSSGGEAVAWHQDIQFWPHSDFSPLTIGVYLTDVDATMGPMGILPGSHRGPLYRLYDADGRWTGQIAEADLDELDLGAVDYLEGPAGMITVHNCCAVHGSAPNESERVRPLLLQTYSAHTSYPLLGAGVNGATGPASGSLVGDPPFGEPTITIEGRDIPTAPNFSQGGYTTIFDVQQG
ncbi:MAG: phytanoyl-CoA dioxygenase family protein [Acidimicrobiales bacterium]|nr:phytanoyl-CoA dioxygenase family protein [Acidimicrobiales bacterium]